MTYYNAVPKDQLDHLLAFRARHPPTTVDIAGVPWEYIACGRGPDALLLLPGALFVAEHVFNYIEGLEETCRVIVPTYPPLADITALTQGLATLLEMEQMPSIAVWGMGSGGMVAQVFAMRFPARVSKLILSSSGPLLASRVPVRVLSFISSLLAILPEQAVTSLYHALLSQVVVVPKSEKAFWRAYLKEIFTERITKANVVSSLRQGEGALKHYALDRPGTSPWPGTVLSLEGENDATVTPNDRAMLKKFYPHAQMQVIPSVSHTPGRLEIKHYVEAAQKFLSASN